MIKLTLIFHLLAATVWTGGHLVLAIGFLPRGLKRKDPNIIKEFENVFEKIGIPALLIQIVTGLILANNYQPDWSAWFGFSNHINTHLTLKFITLGLTLVLALHARLRIIPDLDEENLNYLAWHIIPVTILSVFFVIIGISFRTGGLF